MHKRNTAFLSVVFFIFTVIIFSCASTPEESVPDVSAAQAVSADDFSVTAEEPVAVAIPVPRKRERTYFSSIDKTIVDAVENGSPSSLREAAAMLHKGSGEENTENEKVLLNVCAAVMKICWPSQNIAIEEPEADFSTPYMGAIDSARRGIYDSSTGNSDFLTLVLPSLVLLVSDTRSDYYPDSEEALKKSLEYQPDSVLANYLLGVLMKKQKRYAESLEYFTNASENSSGCFEIQSECAFANRNAGHNAEALALAEQLLVMNPQNIKLLELCAETSDALKNAVKAEMYVSRVLMLEPENSRYVLFRARLLMNKSDYIKASSLLDVYSRTNQASCEYLLLRARLQCEWNKNTTTAVATMTEALSAYPENLDVLSAAAKLASDSNQIIDGKSALELAQEILVQDSNSLNALVICVTEYIKNGLWNDAYEISRQIIQRPDCPGKMFSTHISICLELEKNEEADSLIERLYSENPDDETIQEQYLKVLVAFGRKDEGLALISELMYGANSRMKSVLLYEKSFFETDETDVLNDLRSSLTSNPRNKDALFRLYKIYYGRKDWRRAQYYLKQVVALNPADQENLRLNAELESLMYE